jgi:sugar (pentulose or hexulose) kinase
MTELLLGIDVGTSACKAAVLDEEGTELALAQVPTPWERVPTGAETDPDRLFQAAATAARRALAQSPHGNVAGIGVASIAETGALLDEAGRALHPAIAWHDSRGAAAAQEMARALPDFVDRSGLMPIEVCTVA